MGFGVKPCMEHLRVIWSMGHAHVEKTKRTKMDPKGYKCLFLRYAENTKGYRVYDLDAHKLQVVRSVKLDKREVSGIYYSTISSHKMINQVIDDEDNTFYHEKGERPAQDEPMECPDEFADDYEMQEMEDQKSPRSELNEYPRMDNKVVFRPEPA